MGIVGKWAENMKISYTTYTDLSSKPEVYDLLEREVAKVNETLPAAARIRKFVLLYKELDADDEELTRTRKVRRNVVEERYRDVIAALYGETEAVDIDTTIKFQDGKVTRIQARLPVRHMQRKVA
jgi:long-chain acyl-CoA synthetase